MLALISCTYSDHRSHNVGLGFVEIDVQAVLCCFDGMAVNMFLLLFARVLEVAMCGHRKATGKSAMAGICIVVASQTKYLSPTRWRGAMCRRTGGRGIEVWAGRGIVVRAGAGCIGG